MELNLIWPGVAVVVALDSQPKPLDDGIAAEVTEDEREGVSGWIWQALALKPATAIKFPAVVQAIGPIEPALVVSHTLNILTTLAITDKGKLPSNTVLRCHTPAKPG